MILKVGDIIKAKEDLIIPGTSIGIRYYIFKDIVYKLKERITLTATSNVSLTLWHIIPVMSRKERRKKLANPKDNYDAYVTEEQILNRFDYCSFQRKEKLKQINKLSNRLINKLSNRLKM